MADVPLGIHSPQAREGQEGGKAGRGASAKCSGLGGAWPLSVTLPAPHFSTAGMAVGQLSEEAGEEDSMPASQAPCHRVLG